MGTSLELSNQTQTGNWLGGRSELTWITGLSVNHFRERKREIGHEKRNPPIREVAARTQIYAPHRTEGRTKKSGRMAGDAGSSPSSFGANPTPALRRGLARYTSTYSGRHGTARRGGTRTRPGHQGDVNRRGARNTQAS
jgi:hypothetical protein